MPAIVNITLTPRLSSDWRIANFLSDSLRRASTFARFWSAVQRADPASCWLWTGSTNGRGYGLFMMSSIPHLRVRAHRFAWMGSRGEIPAGLEVCHNCPGGDNTLCVNPSHLFLGTRRDNHLDAVRKGRKRAWGLQKLNAEQVRQIRARSEAGELQRLIATDYGVSRNTVSQIANRKTWTHLGASDSLSQ